MKKINRKEAEEKITNFFLGKHDKEEVRKIKRLAMSYNLKLGEKRKLFCKKCYGMRISVRRIKNHIKTVECRDCGNIMRWKIK